MKLTKSESGGGFYEAFSDIIFATMAIFVLLMTLFLILAEESSPVRKAEGRLEAVRAEIEAQRDEIAKIQARTQATEEEVSAVAERHVEIAIAVDKTGSMEQELYNLKNAILRLAEILPKVTDSLRIGLVAYRINESTQRNETDVFPMTEIRARDEDGGRSYDALSNYLARQRHASGAAPVLEATREAIGLLNHAPGYKGHQVFMLLGDVGPYENHVSDLDAITPEGERRAQVLVNTIGGWAKGRKDRNVIILFSGRDEINRFEFGIGPARRHKHKISMDLFRSLAEAAGQADGYTENQSTMLVDFIVAALKRK